MTLISAVFSKEMVGLARRKRHYGVRALVLGGLLMAVYVGWGNIRSLSAGSGFADTAIIGQGLFRLFYSTQLGLVLLLVPGLAASAVAPEKERDTLGLLLMTNLTRTHILLDKLLSRLLLVGFLILSGLPMLLALLSFGGIETDMIVMAYAEVMGTFFLCSAIGLLCSTLMSRSYAAIMASYVLLGCYLALATWAW